MHRIIEPIIAAILTIALLETTRELLGRPVAWAVGVAIFTLIAVVLWRRSWSRPSPWRPIATAPRDGTEIMLAFGRDGVRCGMWAPSRDGEWPWRFFDQPKAPQSGEPIVNGAYDGPRGPSHWAPKPAGPTFK